VRQILFRGPTEPKATPVDRETKAREALAKAETAKAALDKGADFAQLANQVSEDPDNISTDGKTRLGGLLPRWISEDDAAEFGEEYVRAALALGPSQISAITVMRGGKYPGLVILEQEETRQKSYPALEDIRQKVEADCAESMLGRKFEEKYAELEQKTKNYSRLEDMSQALAMTVGMSSWTLTTSPVIAPELGVLDRATLDYINEELKPGDRSVLLKSSDLLYILEVVNHRPTYIPKYEEARDKVEAAYRMEKGRELMSAAKDEFLKKSTSADAMRAAAAAGGLQVKTTDFFTREAMPGDMPGPLMDFERDSFTAKPGSIHASLVGLSKDEFSGCVVWHLKEVQDPDRAEFLKNVAVLQHDLSLLGQRALADEWLWDQRKAMEIEINQQLLGREM
jgi:peptidyl-prolyl cis-trans isomerase D